VSAPAASASQRVALAISASSGGAVVVNANPLYACTTTRAPGRRVALVSGGGAGHEPLHLGFLGTGGLDAVCPGEVFASPHSRQIYEAGRAAALPGGVLQIVKNYTGDLINFGIAAERLAADGLEVRTVVVKDDIGTTSAGLGMRGTAATVVVEKVLGAAADSGATLEELVTLGERLVADSRSLAVAFEAHHDRETGQLAFTIDEGLFEFGVGIHGERASAQIPAEDLSTLVARMTGDLLAAHPTTRPLVVLVNGLGGISNFDLANVAHQVLEALRAAQVQVESIVVGTFVSALDMRGFSLTFTDTSEDWLPLWYADHDTAALPRPRPLVEALHDSPLPAPASRERASSPWALGLTACFADLRRGFNALDARAGDGDFGDNIARGTAAAVDTDAPEVDQGVSADLRAFSAAFLDDVGGSSGPLLGVLLQAAAAETEGANDLPAALAAGLAAGADAVSRVGGAQPGDRTMIDALTAFVSGHLTEVDREAAERALDDALATARMRPRRGRATYLADRVAGVPDAGALAVAGLVIALSERVSGEDHLDLWSRLVSTVRDQPGLDGSGSATRGA
jgi:dihydroxyacetone kinase